MVVQIKGKELSCLGGVNCPGRRGDVAGNSVMQAIAICFHLKVSIALLIQGINLNEMGVVPMAS